MSLKRTAFDEGVKASNSGSYITSNPYVETDLCLAFFWVEGFLS